jgi:capsule polysaccharide export protein KpsE/RkpR
MNKFFQNLDLLHVLQKRRLHLAAIAIMAGVLAVVFSGETFIQPKYKSTAYVYPVNIIPYSMETPTEQLLQLFSSSDVRNMMVKRFRLPDHYEVDTASSSGLTKLYLEYEENVSVKKTEYESVKIDILDKDPRMASEMVAELINFVDIKARSVQREKTAEVVRIFADQLRRKKQQVDSVDVLLSALRVRYGLLDYKSQTKEVTKSYLKLASNNSQVSQYRGVDSLYRHLQHRGGDLIALSSQYKSLLDDYNAIKTNYDQAVSDMTKELTYTNVMAKPYPADSKSYPVRWVIVIVTILSSLLLAIIAFVMIEQSKNA